jgi:DnaK suppressor protein
MAGDALNDFTPYQAKKNEEYMNESQREHFQQILLDWKKRLEEEIEHTITHMQNEHLNLPDPNDRASQEEEFSLELRTRDRESKLLRKIGKALKRLANDDYGYCDSCGVEIGIRRLEARPTAELCIDCKQLEEQREKSWAA